MITGTPTPYDRGENRSNHSLVWTYHCFRGGHWYSSVASDKSRYLGMLIGQRLAFGKQLVSLLTPKGPELAEVLRAGDYRVAASRKLPKNDCFFEPSKFRASPHETQISR
jgi:hypothetical protein